MDKRFTDWYKTVDPSMTEDRLKKRWAGIEVFVKSVKIDGALDAVRIFYGLNPSTTEFIDSFSDVFYQQDNTFSANGAERELAILAGVAAVIASERQQEPAINLAISCGRAIGVGATSPLDDLVTLSEKVLVEAAGNLRSSAISKPQIKSLKAQIDALKGNALTDHHQVGNNAATALGGVLETQKNLLQYCEQLHNLADLQKEELDIMWWLYGEYSSAAEANFSDLSREDACIALALDLCHLTQVIPGPLAVKAYLRKALASCKGKKGDKISLQQLISHSSDRIKNALISAGQQIHGLTPIWGCIENYQAHGQGSEWQKIDSKKASVIDITKELEPLELAYQIYREGLLINAVTALSEE